MPRIKIALSSSGLRLDECASELTDAEAQQEREGTQARAEAGRYSETAVGLD